MLRQASRRNAAAIRAGRVTLINASGATAATARNAADEIENLLRTTGFPQLSTETLPLSPPVICVLAAAPRIRRAP